MQTYLNLSFLEYFSSHVIEEEDSQDDEDNEEDKDKGDGYGGDGYLRSLRAGPGVLCLGDLWGGQGPRARRFFKMNTQDIDLHLFPRRRTDIKRNLFLFRHECCLFFRYTGASTSASDYSSNIFPRKMFIGTCCPKKMVYD